MLSLEPLVELLRDPFYTGNVIHPRDNVAVPDRIFFINGEDEVVEFLK